MGQKGYPFFDLKEEKTYTSRNATFVEDMFPFGNNYKSNKCNELDFVYKYLWELSKFFLQIQNSIKFK